MDTSPPSLPPPSGPDPGSEKEPVALPQPQQGMAIPPDERNMAMFCHLGGLAGLVLPSAGNILVPLILWLVNKDKMPFVDQQGKEATNFQISISIYLLASFILGLLTCGTGFILSLVVAVFAIVFVILASIDASNGLPYRYPLCIRLIQ